MDNLKRERVTEKWAQRDNEQDSSIEKERKKIRRLIKIHRYPNLSPL